MLTWMTYAVVVGVPLAVAAALAGRALQITRRATRWVWATAIVTSLALSALAPWRGPLVRGARGACP